MKYKRILLKLSGEALAGSDGNGISPEILSNFATEIKSVYDSGVQIGVVIGGGNFFRGAKGATEGMNKTTADHMGMLATVMNGIALKDGLDRAGVSAVLMSAIEMNSVAETYTYRNAVKYLEDNKVVIFAGGTGNPYFTTDTAATLRACEIEASVVMKATKVDGIYDKDPMKFSDAKKYEKISFSEALKQGLAIMDATAFALCMDNDVDILVFNAFEKGNVLKATQGKKIGSIVTNK